MDRSRLTPTLQALAAATLFGASAPLAKLLLGEIEPIPLAAFLYLGSGIGLTVLRLSVGAANRVYGREAALTGKDWLWAIGAVVTGGIAAPIVMFVSLTTTPAATAALLLNFEGAATTLIAAAAFRESVGLRVWLSVACLTVASVMLSWNVEGGLGFSLGALGILAACALWGLDNNLTRNISGKDALMIVLVKGLGAGAFSLTLGLALGYRLPAPSHIGLALLLGFFSYGLSTALFVRALRGLGAARTSAFYSAAPFVGVVIAFIVFQQIPGGLFFAALLLMIVGTFLLAGERHEHSHIHEPEAHAHRVEVDQHHPTQVGGSAATEHAHERFEHSHPHAPDIHHRHDHENN